MIEEIGSYILNFLLGIIVTAVWNKTRNIAKKTDAIVNAVKNLLRQSIIEIYNRCMALQYIPISERDFLYSLVESYHRLEDDKVVDQLVEIISKLPTEKKGGE